MVVDGVAERSAERPSGRFPVLVFTPDRMRLVQGAPALRRSYFDRVLVRLWPALADVAAPSTAERSSSETTCCGGCARATATPTRSSRGTTSPPGPAPS